MTEESRKAWIGAPVAEVLAKAERTGQPLQSAQDEADAEALSEPVDDPP